jgi:hypothetical protein
MRKISLLVVSAFVLCLTTMSIGAQSKPRVSSTSLERVSLSAYNEETHGKLSGPFQSPENGMLKQYLFVIKNESQKPLFALTVRWKWKDVRGENHFADYTSDSYFPAGSPVLPVGKEMLVSPSKFVPLQLSVDFKPDNKLLAVANQMHQAARIDVNIDTVIYADGEVAGPDDSHTMASILMRAQVAHKAAELLLPTINSKDGIFALLQSMKKGKPSLNVQEALWNSRFHEFDRTQKKSAFSDRVAIAVRYTAVTP